MTKGRWVMRGMVVATVLGLCGATALAQQQRAGARQVFDGQMLPGVEVATFEHSDELFAVNVVLRKAPIRPLPPSTKKLAEIHFQSDGKEYDLFDYLAYNRVAGLLVLKDGKVAFEDYELGAGPQTRWPSFISLKLHNPGNCDELIVITRNASLSPTREFGPVAVHDSPIITNYRPPSVLGGVSLFVLLAFCVIGIRYRAGESYSEKNVNPVFSFRPEHERSNSVRVLFCSGKK